MVRLALTLTAIWVVTTAAATDQSASTTTPFATCGTDIWQPYIEEAAARFGLPPRWLDALILAESAGCATIDGQPTTSRAGAMGLTQLMPEVWDEYRTRLDLASDPFDPRSNILAGSAYLRDLYDRYGAQGVWMAYHAGPTRYEQWLTQSRSLPVATAEYVARIHRLILRGDSTVTEGHPVHASNFASQLTDDNVRRRWKVAHRNDSLFVQLNHLGTSDETGGESSEQEPADVQPK